MLNHQADASVRKKSDQNLPKKLPSAVCAQFVRCGKPTCCCAKGNLHGPYFYCFWKENGRLRKAYIRKADVEAVRAVCEAKRKQRQYERAAISEWRELLAEIREVESHVRTTQA